MSDLGPRSLTADEVRSFHRRITVMRVSLALNFVIALVSLFTLAHLGQFLWMAPVVPVVILSFVLYVRACRCPLCGKSVWSHPPPDEDGNPGFTLFGQLYPDHCRACGVKLISTITAGSVE